MSDSIKYIFHLYPWVNWFAYHFTPGLKKTLTPWSISYWTISTFIHLKIIFLRFSPERKCNNSKPKYHGHNECHNECHQSSITLCHAKISSLGVCQNSASWLVKTHHVVLWLVSSPFIISLSSVSFFVPNCNSSNQEYK